MDKIEADDIFEAAFSEPRWVHVHPDKVDVVMDLFGWSEDDVIIEHVLADDGERYYVSIRKKE